MNFVSRCTFACVVVMHASLLSDRAIAARVVPQGALRIFSAASEPMLLEAKLANGEVIGLFGERDIDGLPVRANWIEYRAPNEPNVRIYLDAIGLPDYIEIEGCGSMRLLHNQAQVTGWAVYGPTGAFLGDAVGREHIIGEEQGRSALREFDALHASSSDILAGSDAVRAASSDACAYAYITVLSCEDGVLRNDVLRAWVSIDGHNIPAVRIGKGLFRAPLPCRPRRLQAVGDALCPRVDKIVNDTCAVWQYAGLDTATSVCLGGGSLVALPWVVGACQSITMLHYLYCGMQMDKYGLEGRGVAGSICDVSVEITDRAIDAIQGGDTYISGLKAFALLRDCDSLWTAESKSEVFDSQNPADAWLQVDGCQRDRRASWQAVVGVPDEGVFIGDSSSSQFRSAREVLQGLSKADQRAEQWHSAGRGWRIESPPVTIDLPTALDPWVTTVIEPLSSVVIQVSGMSGMFISHVRMQPVDREKRAPRPSEEVLVDNLSRLRKTATVSSSVAVHSFWLQTGDTARIDVSVEAEATGSATGCVIDLFGMAGTTPFRRQWEFPGAGGGAAAPVESVVLRFADVVGPVDELQSVFVPGVWALNRIQKGVMSGALDDIMDMLPSDDSESDGGQGADTPVGSVTQEGIHCVPVRFMIRVKTRTEAGRGMPGESAFAVRWEATVFN